MEASARSSTCCAEASRSCARTSVSPGRGLGSTGHARVFGASTPVSFANFDPAMSSWRTSQLSLLEELAVFSETWPRAGMTRSGIASRLAPLAPLTAATGSGLLPTPNQRDWKDSGPTQGNRKSPHLGTVAHWATPKATDADRGGRGDLLQQARGNPSPSGHFGKWPTPHGMPQPGAARKPGPSGNELGRAVNEAERIPTPTAGDAKSARNATAGRTDPDSKHHSGTTLTDYVTPSGGSLNPDWVEVLMGFPRGWTEAGSTASRESPPAAPATTRDCAPSATRSSRKSQSGSAGGSSSSRKK